MTEVSFLDNKEVSIEMINSIALDLGSTTFVPFDNGTYHIDTLNDITADLVTSGVLNYGSKCVVTTDKDITKAIVENGIIVFDSGVKLKITETEDIPLIKGKKNYIYAIHRDANNEAALEASDTGFPATAVKLAEIGTDGKVVNRREYARMINSSSLPNSTFEIDLAGILLKNYKIDIGAYYNCNFLIYEANFSTSNKQRILIDLKNNTAFTSFSDGTRGKIAENIDLQNLSLGSPMSSASDYHVDMSLIQNNLTISAYHYSFNIENDYYTAISGKITLI